MPGTHPSRSSVLVPRRGPRLPDPVRRPRRGASRVVLPLVVTVVAIGPWAAASAASAGDWPAFQGDPGHTGSAPGAAGPPLGVAWRYPSGAGTRVSPPVVVGGSVIVETASSVLAIDANTGDTEWTFPRTEGPVAPVAADPGAPHGGLLVFSQGQGSSASLEGSSLSEAAGLGAAGPSPSPGSTPSGKGSAGWTVALDKPTRGGPTVADGKVFVGTDSGSVYAFDASTGTPDWHAATGGAVVGTPAVADGKVFVVAEDGKDFRGRLVALDEATGKQAWSYSQTAGIVAASSPSVAGGRVVVGFGDGSFRAFRDTNGDALWVVGAGPFRSTTAPALVGDSVYVASSGGELDRLRATDGHREWNFLFDVSSGAATPLATSSVVYVGLGDGSVGAVKMSTGNLVWRSAAGGSPVGPLAPAGGMLVAQHSGTKGGLVAFRPDPSGRLVDVVSPSRLNWARALVNCCIALVVVLAVVAVFWLLESSARTRRRGARS